MKLKIWHVDKSKYAEFNGDVHFHCFWQKISFLDKFGLKNQTLQFKLKFGTQTNLKMEKLMVMVTFSVFDQKYPFWVNLVSKFKIVYVK